MNEPQPSTVITEKFVSAVAINNGTLAETDPDVCPATAEATLQAKGIEDRGDGFPFRYGVWVRVAS